ncbi:MAG TPA: co-chaperone GroES [Candidatus Dojkabacteria bacterium]|nr:co-chaperone GroES [Candidatus Dojkabacteria bacterium]
MEKDIKIQPIGNRVLVKPDEIEEKTSGGLVLPPSASEEQRPETGTVVKLGKGKIDGKEISFEVSVGDRIYFKKYSPDEILIGEDKYLLLNEEDILAIVK